MPCIPYPIALSDFLAEKSFLFCEARSYLYPIGVSTLVKERLLTDEPDSYLEPAVCRPGLWGARRQHV